MADLVQKTATQEQVVLPQVEEEEEVVVVADEKTMPLAFEEKHPPPVPDTEEEPPTKPKHLLLRDALHNEEVSDPINGGDNVIDEKNIVPESGSFQEESNVISHLSDPEKKALQDLKQLVQEGLNNREFSTTKEYHRKENAPQADDVANKKAEAVAEAKDYHLADNEEKTNQMVVDSNSSTADDDGAKTVEAIEETIVAIAPQEQKETEENVALAASSEPTKDPIESEPPAWTPEQVSIWGIPLLADERSDVVLLKFLRARDFRVKEAFTMLKNTLRWRKEFGIDELISKDLGDDLEKTVFMHGFDKEGHPVCYNVYGEFQRKELYHKTFSDEEKRKTFLRWRIQFLERSIRKLDFSPGGISTFVQINDLKNSPGPTKRELRQATSQALQLLQDNYPEFVAKQVFINVPWWYMAVNSMISPFLTQRTRSKFVFAGPSKSAETLLRYIAPEQLPVKYGGLSKNGEFGTTDAVTQITVKPASKHTVEFPVTETCLLTWEARVVGWEVSYGAEFVPSSEESYTVIIQKARKVGASEAPVVCNSFKAGEPGKIVLTIDNPTSKKKKLLYRLKTKPSQGLNMENGK